MKRRALRELLPDINHPRRGLTWITFRRGSRRIVVRTHVVTWEPLLLGWRVQVGVPAPAYLRHRGRRDWVRPLGDFAKRYQAIRFAMRWLDVGGLARRRRRPELPPIVASLSLADDSPNGSRRH